MEDLSSGVCFIGKGKRNNRWEHGFCRSLCMAITAASPLSLSAEILLFYVRAAVSRLAGIADWTTQPRRDAANYPSGSPAPTEEGGIPRGNRLHTPDTRVALLLPLPPPLVSPRISLTGGRLLCSSFFLFLSSSVERCCFKGIDTKNFIRFVLNRLRTKPVAFIRDFIGIRIRIEKTFLVRPTRNKI